MIIYIILEKKKKLRQTLSNNKIKMSYIKIDRQRHAQCGFTFSGFQK